MEVRERIRGSWDLRLRRRTGEAQAKAQNRVGCYLEPKGSGPLLFMCRRVQPYTRLGIEVSSDVCSLTLKLALKGERGA